MVGTWFREMKRRETLTIRRKSHNCSLKHSKMEIEKQLGKVFFSVIHSDFTQLWEGKSRKFSECNSCSSSIIKVCLQFKCNYHWAHSLSPFSNLKNVLQQIFLSMLNFKLSSMGCCLLLLKTSLEYCSSSSSLWIKGNKLEGKELSEWTCLCTVSAASSSSWKKEWEGTNDKNLQTILHICK